MPKNALPLPVLTDDQKSLIETYYYETPQDLLRRVFPDIAAQKEAEGKEFDTRSVHWRAIRVVLATIGKAPKAGQVGAGGTTAVSVPSSKPDELTSQQQEFIRASYKDASGPVELARTLFADNRIMSGDYRVRLILNFIRKIDPAYRREDEPVDDVDYVPPRTAAILIGRLNRFGIGARPDGKKIGDGGITAQEQRQLDALLVNMRRSVFKVEADKFTKKIDRDVFEETFLATTWDKPDLSAEHSLQYVQLASLSAQRNIADRLVRTLDERFLVSLEDPDQRLGKAEVDALKETKDKASEHLRQISQLIKTLTVERKNLMDAQRTGSASMHQLVEAWKRETDRTKIIALAKKKQDTLKQEVERLSTMDSLKAELFGLNPETIVH